MIYLLGLLLQWKFLSEQGAYKEHAFDKEPCWSTESQRISEH